MSQGHLHRKHSVSTPGSRPPRRAATPIDPRTSDVDFDPCAATASIFLFTQGSTIICIHHDSLAIERRVDLHEKPVSYLFVDNVSERNAGRLVASLDTSQTAIVWDLFNGQEISRFQPYESIRVAAWMKNGNIAFGTSQGTVIIFEPLTSEHISGRTIFDPITAIAPAADCHIYAIGFMNGSIMIVTLQPTFTILHTLTSNRAPSPVVTLAWHASSSKQKSDMLATQTSDGDLRVWSIAKPPAADTPRTIRLLKRSDNVEPGLNWCAWSRNGRILQYSDGEAWSWDVRTKHAQCEPLPIVDGIRALANYGPQGTLFTLGPNHTVQQYECSPPAMVKEAQYYPMAPPPASKANQGQYIPGTAPPMPVRVPSHGSESDRGAVALSTIQRTQNEMQAIDQARQIRSGMASPVSSTTSRTSRTDTVSSRSSNRVGIPYPRHKLPSISSRGASGTTFSTISPSMVGRESMFSGTSMDPSTVSITSSGRRSKGSRLRQEILRSTENQFVDLFPRTRVRLANIAYTQPEPVDQDSMTPDDLRRQMLSVVFGWDNDIEPLIRDELRYLQPGSTSSVLLSKWLGEVDSDMMAAAIHSGNISSSDWMVLALSQMGGPGSQTGKMGQAFVQRLLQQGDFHTSATILLGLGDREDAVEVYVSRNFFMEAILLTSLIFPTDWQRQAHLVRRWGEFVVENSQQQLAIRCFSCTGGELPMPWGSPSPRILDTPSQTPSSISSMLSPPISPPGPADSYPPVRMTTKNSALKVITSFEAAGNQGQHRLPGLNSIDRTPTNGPGVTPIAESTITPGNTPGGFSHGIRGLRTRTATPGDHHRHLLPSIGESPVDVTLPPFPRPSQLPTPDNSESDLEKEKELRSRSQPHVGKVDLNAADPPLLLSSARYDPRSAASAGKSPMTALPQTSVRTTILPGPAADTFTIDKEQDRARNMSRDRKPDGLHIRMPSQHQIQHTHYISADGISSGRGEHVRTTTLNPLHSARSDQYSVNSGSLRTARSDTRSDAKSPSISGQSGMSGKSTSVSGRSIDQYISSLGEANSRHRKHKHSSKSRHSSREGKKHGGDHKPRSRPRGQERSEDRGRENRRYIRPAKRSPSSPVPMSPEHYADPENASSLDGQAVVASPRISSRHGKEKGLSKLRSGSKASDNSFRTIRPSSPDGIYDSQLGSETSHNRSKVNSRRPSPRAMLDLSARGRSKSQNDEGSAVRSPSSALPFSPHAQHYQSSDSDEDIARIVEANRQRLRSRHRSESRRRRERGTSARRNRSPDRRREAEDRYTRLTDDSESMQAPRSAVEPRRTSGNQMLPAADQPIVRRQKSLRTQRKALAARELEARRESLLRNPEAPPVPHPDEVSRPGVLSRATDQTKAPISWDPVVPAQHSQRFPPSSAAYETGEVVNRSGAASVGPYGLPATPRAMRHPKFDNKAIDTVPSVPEIPDVVRQLPETYYSGQPMHEFHRSASAPIPEQEPPAILSDLPDHPAFHRGLHSDKRRGNFQPLGEIGQHRRRASGDTLSVSQAPVPGIYVTVNASESQVQIGNVEEPPLLPELQHLSQPPPPPPPQHFILNDPESSSLSSNSNVGMINMILDNEPGDESKVIEVPPPQLTTASNPAPGTRPPGTTVSPTHSHKSRSDNFKNGLKGITESLRSSSRGRNVNSPEESSNTPSPYESVPPLYF